MPSVNDFPVRGKVTEVTADGVQFAPAGGTYVLKLKWSKYRYTGPIGKPVEGLIRVTGRKIYTVPSGGNFITPIVGPPKIIQGLVKYIDDKQIVVQGAANVNVIVELPTGEYSIDLDDGRVRVGAIANVIAFPGATFEPLIPAVV
jgi:hypothetical protein